VSGNLRTQEQRKRCFISYSFDDIDQDKLDYLFHTLKESLGRETDLLYYENLPAGYDINDFMAMLDTVSAVIVILTPSYKRKVIECKGGVHVEFERIWTRYSGLKSEAEGSSTVEKTSPFVMIPLLFDGSYADSTPPHISSVKHVDLRGLKVTRKASGPFQIPNHIQRAYQPAIQQIASLIDAAATVDSTSFRRLSHSYYDRLFVNLRARFNDPTFTGHNYLDTILVKTHFYLRVESQLAYFAIGRKGSGKSTLAQVLPLIHADKYIDAIKIIANDFNLEALYGLYSDKQFRSDIDNAVRRDLAFEFTWEASLILATMEVILELLADDRLNNIQEQLAESIKMFMAEVKGSPQPDEAVEWSKAALFKYAFNATTRFVHHCIDSARTEDDAFLPDIEVRFQREPYLNFLFGVDTLRSFRNLIKTFNQRFLVTLDGFDSAFDRFRRDSIETYNEEQLNQRAHFEIDWLRSLLNLVVEAKTNAEDYFYSIVDFCIVAPEDRFMEVKRVERDSYRYWDRGCSLNWSGIELAILLRKRLEVLAGYKTNGNLTAEERLEEVLRQKPSRNLPIDIEFEYNGRSYRMPLFMYVLRHTFWRPREVLRYYADLLALAESMRRGGHEVTTDAIRRCVKKATERVIQSEFLGEFSTTVVNIRDIVDAFKRCPMTLTYDEVRKILLPLDFKFASGVLSGTEPIEKIRFLYEIGFLGVKVDNAVMDTFGLNLEYAFGFNEGLTWFLRADERDMMQWQFVIHPIFSEYLRLDRNDQELVLHFTWDYLRIGDVVLSTSPDI